MYCVKLNEPGVALNVSAALDSLSAFDWDGFLWTVSTDIPADLVAPATDEAVWGFDGIFLF